LRGKQWEQTMTPCVAFEGDREFEELARRHNERAVRVQGAETAFAAAFKNSAEIKTALERLQEGDEIEIIIGNGSSGRKVYVRARVDFDIPF
jgi:hypothetical protein